MRIQITDDVLTTNILEQTLVALRIIFDGMSHMSEEGGLDVSKTGITKVMLKFYRGARMRHEQCLTEQKNRDSGKIMTEVRKGKRS